VCAGLSRLTSRTAVEKKRVAIEHASLAALLVALASLLLACAAGEVAAQAGGTYADRDDVRQFATEVSSRDGLDGVAVLEALSQAQYQPTVVRLMDPLPAGRRSWRVYRSRFVNEHRIRNGIAFWQEHREDLVRAARDYGVAEEIIVAIIGVETEYGRNMGGFRILDALATLAFDYPRRAEFFRAELEHFLVFARDEHLPADSLRGSYAGAIGIPQFMPGSIRKWAVDFDGDGRRDLIESAADAIGSVANFLREHGWQTEQAVAVPARVSGGRHRVLLELGVQPFVAARELDQYAVKALAPVPPDAPVALIELETPDRPSKYYLGLQNFYVVTRYNQSSFYAISVIELAKAIKQRLQAAQ
jgi:membrane-bound lytic murein transglycosylase B